jgi:hypothetical protein|tara:strand:- start:546 stop:797 length:252 start_codon:yes stop_codon:yes gene_type:complete
MVEFLNEYWAWTLIIIIILCSNVLNLTVFADRDVRSAKHEIDEAGIGATEDKAINSSLKWRRRSSTRLMWFLCSILFFISIIF